MISEIGQLLQSNLLLLQGSLLDITNFIELENQLLSSGIDRICQPESNIIDRQYSFLLSFLCRNAVLTRTDFLTSSTEDLCIGNSLQLQYECATFYTKILVILTEDSLHYHLPTSFLCHILYFPDHKKHFFLGYTTYTVSYSPTVHQNDLQSN